MQLEFPFALGPPAGRHAIRERAGEAPAHVLVLERLGAPQRRLLARRRPTRRAAPPDPPPAPVQTTRATLVDAVPLASPQAAERWLEAVDVDAVAAAAVARLDAVLHAYRIAAADPYAPAVSLAHALVARVGFGDGEAVAAGRWERARELPPARAPRRPRAAGLAAQERLARLLGGTDVALACESLALRARADADAGRWREAALGLRAALDAADCELEPWCAQAPSLEGRLAELRAGAGDVAATAAQACRGGLDDARVECVRAALGRLEAALRARAAGAR